MTSTSSWEATPSTNTISSRDSRSTSTTRLSYTATTHRRQAHHTPHTRRSKWREEIGPSKSDASEQHSNATGYDATSHLGPPRTYFGHGVYEERTSPTKDDTKPTGQRHQVITTRRFQRRIKTEHDTVPTPTAAALRTFSAISCYADDILLTSTPEADIRRYRQKVFLTFSQTALERHINEPTVRENERFLKDCISRHEILPILDDADHTTQFSLSTRYREMLDSIKLVNFFRTQNTNTLPDYAITRRTQGQSRLMECIRHDIDTYCSREAGPLKHMVISIDTTTMGIGSSIIQTRWDEALGWIEFPLRYTLVPFTPAQRLLSVHDREQIALQWTLKQFSHLVRYIAFSIRHDRRLILSPSRDYTFAEARRITSHKVTHWITLLTDNSLLFERAFVPSNNDDIDLISR